MASFIAFLLSAILLLFGILFIVVTIWGSDGWPRSRLVAGFVLGLLQIFAAWGCAYLGGI